MMLPAAGRGLDEDVLQVQPAVITGVLWFRTPFVPYSTKTFVASPLVSMVACAVASLGPTTSTSPT